MANVYIVKRTSTTHQDMSLEQQDSTLRNWVQEHGHVVAGESVENGISGGKDFKKRNGVMKLITSMNKGDILAVYSLSRLTRSLGDLLAISKLLEKKGCHLATLQESINTTSPMGRFFFNIMGSIFQLEREMIQNRVLNGLNFKRSKGEKLGGKCAPYGFDVKETPSVNKKGEPITIKTLVLNKKECEVIEIILDMRKKQYTLQGIADALNADNIPSKQGSIWMPMTVRNIIKREEAALEKGAR
jgi:site-specific DNA recombinase